MRRWRVGGQTVIEAALFEGIWQDPKGIGLTLWSWCGVGKWLGGCWVTLPNNTSHALVLTAEKAEMSETGLGMPYILAWQASAGWSSEPHSSLPRGGGLMPPSTILGLLMRKEEFKEAEWRCCMPHPHSQS